MFVVDQAVVEEWERHPKDKKKRTFR